MGDGNTAVENQALARPAQKVDENGRLNNSLLGGDHLRADTQKENNFRLAQADRPVGYRDYELEMFKIEKEKLPETKPYVPGAEPAVNQNVSKPQENASPAKTGDSQPVTVSKGNEPIAITKGPPDSITLSAQSLGEAVNQQMPHIGKFAKGFFDGFIGDFLRGFGGDIWSTAFNTLKTCAGVLAFAGVSAGIAATGILSLPTAIAVTAGVCAVPSLGRALVIYDNTNEKNAEKSAELIGKELGNASFSLIPILGRGKAIIKNPIQGIGNGIGKVVSWYKS